MVSNTNDSCKLIKVQKLIIINNKIYVMFQKPFKKSNDINEIYNKYITYYFYTRICESEFNLLKKVILGITFYKRIGNTDSLCFLYNLMGIVYIMHNILLYVALQALMHNRV